MIALFALFAYVATSAFILQSMNGLSPLAYSLAFGANAAGMALAALASARLAARVPTRHVILVGQALALGSGLVMLAGRSGWPPRCLWRWGASSFSWSPSG